MLVRQLRPPRRRRPATRRRERRTRSVRVQSVPVRLLPALGATRRPVRLSTVPLLLLATAVRRRGVLSMCWPGAGARLPLRRALYPRARSLVADHGGIDCCRPSNVNVNQNFHLTNVFELTRLILHTGLLLELWSVNITAGS